jgi:1A family penicillin-binding protein
MRRLLLVTFVLTIAGAAWYGVVLGAAMAYGLAADMDHLGALADLAPRPQATIVFDRHGQPAFSYFVEQRIDVPLSSVSPHVIDAILSVEDRRFYWHRGIDPMRIAASAWRNLKARRIVQGGSTITQQLARVSQLSPVRTYSRKVREAILASRLEQRYSKDEILERYLNTVYFGEGFYGIEAASRGYFSKTAADLRPHEAALLAALVRSPSQDSPCASVERAMKRRNLVLRLMHGQGKLTRKQFDAAMAQPLPDPGHRRAAAGVLLDASKDSGLYFQEELRQQLVAAFGEDRVLRGGLRVRSTYDPEMQRAAEAAIAGRIASIARSRAAARDLQGSLVALDPATGDVLALVGGRNFNESPFNRATQARRQPGSAFKPIIAAAAIERGYAPGTMLHELDAPIYADASTNKVWMPAGDHERSEYTLRTALVVSSNRAAAHLLQQVGLSSAIYTASRMGITSTLPMVPSLALGTGEVTLMELTTAYTAFANHGTVTYPRLFTRVEQSDGAVLWESQPRQSQALSPTTAYLMSDMLADVVNRGTASTARAAGFRLPAAGKTGTTDDYTDAWFVGYTPHLVAGVWFGLDKPAPIMDEGWAGTVAVPAWAQFMRAATAGARPDWYQMPADVERVAICSLSGARATDACRHGYAMYEPDAYGLRAANYTPGAVTDTDPTAPIPAPRPVKSYVYEDLFPIGAVPTEECWMHATNAPIAAPTPVQPAFQSTLDPPAPVTPIVDDILRSTPPPVPVGTTGTDVGAPSIIVTSNGTKISIQRVVGADGVVRTIVKQIR